VVGVAYRVKTLGAQGSDGSFSGVREDDILTAALETLEHRGWVRGVSSSLGWGKGFGEEFAGMYRKKRNKRSDDHVMMDITFKSTYSKTIRHRNTEKCTSSFPIISTCQQQ
jgi:hypothetical protein